MKTVFDRLHRMLQDAPVRLARMLGVPVIHANLVGDVRGTSFTDRKSPIVHRFMGESQIVNGHGHTLAIRPLTEGEGIVTACVQPARVEPTEEIRDEFWTPDMTSLMKFYWYEHGALGRKYYLETTRPHRIDKPKGRQRRGATQRQS